MTVKKDILLSWLTDNGLTLAGLNLVDHAHSFSPAGAGQVSIHGETVLGLVSEFLQVKRKTGDRGW